MDKPKGGYRQPKKKGGYAAATVAAKLPALEFDFNEELSYWMLAQPTPMSLQKAWATFLRGCWGLATPKATQKELGQFKHWAGKLLEIDGKFYEARPFIVMAYAIRSWPVFTKQTGVKVSPKSPDIGFLLKHAQAALELTKYEVAQEGAKAKKKAVMAEQKEQVEPVQLIAPVVEPQPQEPIESAEDILAEFDEQLKDFDPNDNW